MLHLWRVRPQAPYSPLQTTIARKKLGSDGLPALLEQHIFSLRATLLQHPQQQFWRDAIESGQHHQTAIDHETFPFVLAVLRLVACFFLLNLFGNGSEAGVQLVQTSGLRRGFSFRHACLLFLGLSGLNCLLLSRSIAPGKRNESA